MQFFLYLAAIVIGSVLAYALAPKPPKQKAPALGDFDVPTAERGRPIPWVFGTRKVKGPNCIWYGDLEVRTKTKDKVKTRLYRMGLHLEVCIGPVDLVSKIHYGEKVAWSGEVTSSGSITISQPNLYGGRDKEGGIDGTFDLCFGESAQAVNSYLQAQLGTPLSAFRDSFCIVGRKPSLAANSTLIRPIQPTVRCITAGWPDDTCWYPETAIIPGDAAPTLSYDTYAAGGEGGTALDYWWSLDQDLSAGNASNKGVEAGGTLVLKNYALGGTFNTTPVTLNTENDGAFYRNGAAGVGWMNVADIAVQPLFPFTAGVWFNLSTATQQILFKSNVGGDQGFWRGVDIYAESTSRISVVLGDGIGGSYRLQTPADSITGTGDHFVVLYCDPQLSLMGTVASLKLYIDGALQTLTYYTGTATGIAWPITASNPSGWTGVAFDWTGDTYGDHPEGTRDEPFFHWGELSAETIAELWCRGSGTCTHDGLDMNPAHIIYKAWVDTHQGMAEDAASIDDTAMRYAADIFYAERLGLSLIWNHQSPIRDFVAEILRHAGAVQSINPDTGALKIIALRDDYDPGTLDLITEDQIVEVVEWQDAADGEAINQVSVVYEDRDGFDDTKTWSNRASVARHGVIAETRQYPGITNATNALRLAKRDVKQSSSNLSRGKIKVNRHGWDKYPGDVFKLSHDPEDIDLLIVRVMEIDTGTLQQGTITLTVMQDVFSLPLTVDDITDAADGWTPPDTDPAAASTQDVIEAPFWSLVGDLGAANAAALGVGAGYLVSLAVKSSAVAEGYNRWTRISPTDYAETGEDVDFAPSATLTAALDRSTDSAIALSGGTDLDLVEAGWVAMIGTGTSAELCYVFEVNTTTNEATLLRGRLDTTPQEHAAGTRVWFLDGDAPDWPRDPTQWSDGDAVNVKLQPITGGGVLDLDSASAMTGTLDSRQVRPYPTGNVALNAEAHPAEILGTLEVTWSHRDRLVQGYSHVSQYDATDYGPEAGTTYNGYIYDHATDALITSASGMTGTTWTPTLTSSGELRLELEAVRDGYVSWQRQVRRFTFIADRARIVVSGDPRETTSGTIRDTTG